MNREIRAEYGTQYLLPPSVEDWVARDHPARFIREFVDMLDLSELGFKVEFSEEGGPVYATDLLLKAWLYGYFDRIRSSRRLEKACRDNLALVWLTGNHAPDHNTLWRFFKNNRTALKKLFKRVVRVAVEADLVGMALNAVDGTKIKSMASRESVWSRKEVEKLLKLLDESANKMMNEVEENESKETFEYRLPEEMKDRGKLRETLRHALTEMDEAGRNFYHPVDPEVRMMSVGGKTEPGYNAQVVVDNTIGIIVAEEVVNEENDKHMLMAMIDEVEKNVGDTAVETLADAGYCSSEELSKAEERNCSVLVNVRSESAGEFHWSRFYYDEKRNCVVCPLGKRLEFSHVDHSEKQPRRVYICKSHKECARRWECSSSKRIGRRIKLLPHQMSLLRNQERMREPSNKKLMRKRKVIVEPVFGVIKECMGFRRWTVGGLENVQAQWSILCTAFNLKKLYLQWLNGQFIVTNT